MTIPQRPHRGRRRGGPMTGAQRRRLRDLAVVALRRHGFTIAEVAALFHQTERRVLQITREVESVAAVVVGDPDDD